MPRWIRTVADYAGTLVTAALAYGEGVPPTIAGDAGLEGAALHRWGPVRSANGAAEAEGRATFVQDAGDPEGEGNRVDVRGELRDLRSGPPAGHHGCAYVEFQYHDVRDPAGEWRPGGSHRFCVACAGDDAGGAEFRFGWQRADGLRVRVGQIATPGGDMVEPGEWREVAAVG